MCASKRGYVIAQLSDIHCGDPRFDDALMLSTIRGVNEAAPDLVVVPGDLTANGYIEQFEQAASYLSLIECPQRVVIAGNHDCRNVGYVLFERVFGPRNVAASFDFPLEGAGARLKLFAVDSNIPDLNDGEVGRDKIERIGEEMRDADFRVFALHHHLVSIPGTGRERNIVWDAGDVLQALRDARVDLVLAGHKHVPYSWPVAEMLVVTSGTASTLRTRGENPPSYTITRVFTDRIEVTARRSDGGGERSLRFPRHPSPERPVVL